MDQLVFRHLGFAVIVIFLLSMSTTEVQADFIVKFGENKTFNVGATASAFVACLSTESDPQPRCDSVREPAIARIRIQEDPRNPCEPGVGCGSGTATIKVKYSYKLTFETSHHIRYPTVGGNGDARVAVGIQGSCDPNLPPDCGYGKYGTFFEKTPGSTWLHSLVCWTCPINEPVTVSGTDSIIGKNAKIPYVNGTAEVFVLAYANAYIGTAISEVTLREVTICWSGDCEGETYTADVVQVVYGPDIDGNKYTDLVLNKETALRITGPSSSPNKVQVEAKLADKVVVPLQYVELKTNAKGNREGFAYVEKGEPGTPGSGQTLEVFVDGKPIDENIEIDVKDTGSLRVGYIRIDGCDSATVNCYGPPQKFGATVENSGKFIKATYPVSESNYEAKTNLEGGQDQKGPFYGSTTRGWDGIKEDISKAGTWAIRNGFDAGIVVVPKKYFTDFHNYNAAGLARYPTKGAIITDGLWTAAAHELAHTYKFGILSKDGEEEEYNKTKPEPGNPANGYWVSEKESVDNSFCFMGIGPRTETLEPIPETFDKTWIDKDHYEELFKKLLFGPDDPEILIVAAILHRDGTVNLRPWYYVANGNVTESITGEYSIRVMDSNGKILTETSFPGNFLINLDYVGIQPVNSIPIVMAVPYPDTAAEVQVLRNTTVLASVSPTEKLLHDAIDAIPDGGFVKNPEQRRNTLHNKINAVENMLSAGNAKGAQQKLTQDIIPSIEQWILNDYSKTQLNQLEKEEVLMVVAEVAERVGNL